MTFLQTDSRTDQATVSTSRRVLTIIGHRRGATSSSRPGGPVVFINACAGLPVVELHPPRQGLIECESCVSSITTVDDSASQAREDDEEEEEEAALRPCSCAGRLEGLIS